HLDTFATGVALAGTRPAEQSQRHGPAGDNGHACGCAGGVEHRSRPRRLNTVVITLSYRLLLSSPGVPQAGERLRSTTIVCGSSVCASQEWDDGASPQAIR